ncbi:MAG: tetratricopeptide repeat protein, partial [Pseudomonadota bacterium]
MPSQDSNNLIDQAIRYHQNNDIEKALEIYHHFLKDNHDHSGLLNLTGVAYGQLNQYDRSRDYLFKAVKISPDDDSIHLNLATLFSTINKNEQALVHANKAIELDEKKPGNYAKRANIYMKLFKYDQAHHDLLKAYKLDPDNTEILSEIVNCLCFKECWEEALEYYKQYKSNPGFEETPHSLSLEARILNGLEQIEESKNLYEKILKLDDTHVIANLNLALLCDLTQDFQRASQLIHKASFYAQEKNVVQWNLALHLLSHGNYHQGWALYKQWRWKIQTFIPYRRYFDIPEWKGQALKNRHLLIHGEQ